MDGRGASLYTAERPNETIGKAGSVKLIVAADVSQGTPLIDAARCLRDGKTNELVANLRAIAYVRQHEVSGV